MRNPFKSILPVAKAAGHTPYGDWRSATPGIKVTHSLLAEKTPAWRSRLVLGAMMLSFGVLIARAAYVQGFGSGFFIDQGEARYARTLELPPDRGRVLDRNGVVLAASVPAQSIWAIPKDVNAKPAQKAELARALGISASELNNRLGAHPTFVWLKRQVDATTAERVLGLKLNGIHSQKEPRRIYPGGATSAQLVGLVTTEGIGQEGIEKVYEDQLKGEPGSRRVIKDRLGRIVDDIDELELPEHGTDVILTIDQRIQALAFDAVKEAVLKQRAKAGSAVVLDAQSGEILAMANYPSYDPDKRESVTIEALRNRAITDIFEPGSTMKPFSISLALEMKKVTPDTVISTYPGTVTVGGRTIRDTHPLNQMTVTEVIQKSSNVGTTKIAMNMAAADLHRMYRSAGFGQKIPLDFPGVANGRLRKPETWKPIEQATMSYGYGLSASLLQIARAYTVFATDGFLLPVRLTSPLTEPPARSDDERVLSAQTTQIMRSMLQKAAGPGGTASLAMTPGYSVGGKTGTARKQEGRGYSMKAYRSWFVGLSPVTTPRLIIGVMVDEPSAGAIYGGAVAAPVFSKVSGPALQMLGVPPDLEIPVAPGKPAAAAVTESIVATDEDDASAARPSTQSSPASR